MHPLALAHLNHDLRSLLGLEDVRELVSGRTQYRLPPHSKDAVADLEVCMLCRTPGRHAGDARPLAGKALKRKPEPRHASWLRASKSAQ